jgi:hypothetical protein
MIRRVVFPAGEPNHPFQEKVRKAFTRRTDGESPDFAGIDGHVEPAVLTPDKGADALRWEAGIIETRFNGALPVKFNRG